MNPREIGASVEFEVEGVPPKKDQANSSWKRGSTARARTLKLRDVAKAAMNGGPPLCGPLRMEAQIRLGRFAGDIDNLIGGILDALQRPPKSAGLIDEEAIIFADDRQVRELSVSIIPGDPHYSVTITQIDALPGAY